MNIVVCVKNVPEVAEEELEINDEGTDIEREELGFALNEWDNYAVEEAVRLKESLGGAVTVVTIGKDDDEDVLRRSLAMGADEAIMVEGEELAGVDASAVSLALSKVLASLEYDLVLCGAQAADDNFGQVGVALAERLNLPYASLVTAIRVENGRITAERELESGMYETVELGLPALLTIQSGINEPRYVSIMGIRKVRNMEIKQRGLDDLELSGEDVAGEANWFESVEMTLPSEGEGAEILSGSLDEICARAAAIIKEKGGLS